MIALLLEGLLMRDQRKVSASPSTSVDALPFRCTVVPARTVCAGPALATGGEFNVEIVTVEGALSAKPSFTTNWATYVPLTSATNVGFTAPGFDSWAALCAGTLSSDHR